MNFKNLLICSILIFSLCSLLTSSQYYEDDENSEPKLVNYKKHETDDYFGSSSVEDRTSSENRVIKRNDPKHSLSVQERKLILNKVNHLIKLLNQKKAM